MKLGINGADEMTPTVPNMPLLGLISVFDIVSALIVTTQHRAISRDSALLQLETDSGLLTVQYSTQKSIHQTEVLGSHEGLPLWECTQSQYCKPLLIAASKKWVGHV